MIISAGGAQDFTFKSGDVGPVFTDGNFVHGLRLGFLTLRDYIASQVTGGGNLPSPAGNLGKALVVLDQGLGPTWLPGQVGAAGLAPGAALANLGYAPVSRAGDTITGNLIVQGGLYLGPSTRFAFQADESGHFSNLFWDSGNAYTQYDWVGHTLITVIGGFVSSQMDAGGNMAYAGSLRTGTSISSGTTITAGTQLQIGGPLFFLQKNGTASQIVFDQPGNVVFQYDTTIHTLGLYLAGVPKFAVDTAGNMTITGTFNAAGYTFPAGVVGTAAIANGAVTAAKLAPGAAVSNIGYTPANKAGDTFTGNVGVTGDFFVTGSANANGPIFTGSAGRVSISTDGATYGQITFDAVRGSFIRPDLGRRQVPLLFERCGGGIPRRDRDDQGGQLPDWAAVTQTPFQLPPGLVADDTTFAAPGRWRDAQMVRFYEDNWQVRFGWEQLMLDLLGGVCRSVLCWTDTAANLNIAFGTHATLEIWQGGSHVDITPAAFVPGAIDGTGHSGYGTGTWDTGLYGAPQSGSGFPLTWSLGNFGQELMACPRGQTIFQWLNVLANKAIPVPNAPAQVTYVLVNSQRQVMAFGCNEEVSGVFNPLCIRFSDIEDPTAWTTLPSNNAGEVIPARQGAASSPPGWSANYIFCGPKTPSTWGPISAPPTRRGASTGWPTTALDQPRRPPSVKSQLATWIGPDGQFYACVLGGVPQIVPCPIRTDFVDHLATGQNDKIIGSNDQHLRRNSRGSTPTAATAWRSAAT